MGRVFSFPPGNPTETLRVVPKIVPPGPTVTSRASTNLTEVGLAFSDAITVTGVPPGRTVAITPRLIGPLPPVDGSCAAVTWTTLEQPPVAAQFPTVTLDRDDTVSTPLAVAAQPGCYNFDAVITHDLLTGGSEPVNHGLGEPSEVVLVLPAGELAFTGPDAEELAATGPAEVPTLLAIGIVAVLAGTSILAVNPLRSRVRFGCGVAERLGFRT